MERKELTNRFGDRLEYQKAKALALYRAYGGRGEINYNQVVNPYNIFSLHLSKPTKNELLLY